MRAFGFAMAWFLLLCATARAESLLFVGDSLTSNHQWVDTLEATHPQHHFEIQAYGGLQTAAYLPGTQRFADLCTAAPDAAYVMLGSNDAIHQVDPDIIAANLQAIAFGLLDCGVPRITLTPPPRGFGGFPEWFSARLRTARATMHRLCAEWEQLACGPDLYELVQVEHMGPDGLHFNAAGYDAMARWYTPLQVPEPETEWLVAAVLGALAGLWIRSLR